MRASARMDERGMSLVEVLVALTILALALLGLMPLFVSAVKTAASANQLTNANTLVREKFEELAGYPRGDGRLAVPGTYTVEQFAADLVTRVTTPVAGPAPYIAKLVTVNVRPTQGPFPGLRQTTQSLYLRFPNG